MVDFMPAVQDEGHVSQLLAHAALAYPEGLPDVVRQSTSIIVDDIAQGTLGTNVCQHTPHLPEALVSWNNHDVGDGPTRKDCG